MKKNKIIIVVAVLLLIVLAALFFVGKNKKQGTSSAENKTTNGNTVATETTKPTTTGLKGMGSLQDLLKLNRDVKCTVTYAGDTPIKQTMYLSGKLMRADMTMTVPGQNAQLDTHMILDGDLMYSWTSQSTVGTTLDLKNIKPVEGTSKTADEAQASKLKDGLSQQVSYDCAPWTADTTYFDVPKNITFTNITQNINSLQPQIKTPTDPNAAKPSTCSVCDSLSGDLKTKCKDSMGC